MGDSLLTCLKNVFNFRGPLHYKFKEVLEELFALKLNGKISGRESQLQKAKKLMGSMK